MEAYEHGLLEGGSGGFWKELGFWADPGPIPALPLVTLGPFFLQASVCPAAPVAVSPGSCCGGKASAQSLGQGLNQESPFQSLHPEAQGLPAPSQWVLHEEAPAGFPHPQAQRMHLTPGSMSKGVPLGLASPKACVFW